MKTTKYRLFLGQVIQIRLCADGRAACPVCGFILNGCMPYLAWSSEATAKSDNDPANPAQIIREEDRQLEIASGSHEICPCCDTQYGEDDFIDNANGPSQHEKWRDLRATWLRSGAVTAQIRKQLANIGVVIDDNGNQISDINLTSSP